MKTHLNKSHSIKVNGFTLIELLVVISIVGILVAILVPSLAKVRESARSAKSVSNLRQLGAAINSRAAEHGGRYPITFGPQVPDGPNVLWSHEISPYVSLDDQAPSGTSSAGLVASLWPLFISPTTIAAGEVDTAAPYLDSTYSMNGNLNEVLTTDDTSLNKGLPVIRVVNPAQTVLLVDGGQWAIGSQADASLYNVYQETKGSTTPSAVVTTTSPNADGLYGHGTVSYRDQNRAATVWCDGHVSHVEKGKFKHKHFMINF